METKKRKLSADNRAKAKVKKGMSIKERVVILESNVLADLKNANDIITMLNMCDEGGETSYAALHALHRVFGKLYVGVSAKSAASSSQAKVEAWLKEQYLDFVARLIEFVKAGSDELSIPALNVLMDFISTSGLKTPKFPNTLFARITSALFDGTAEKDELVLTFIQKFLEYDDVRHYTCKNLAKLCNECAADKKGSKEMAVLANNAYVMLNALPSPIINPDEIQAFAVNIGDEKHILRQQSTYRRSYSDVWLGFLKLKLPVDVFKSVLSNLPDNVMPNLVDPKLLVDFLRDSYEIGGVISVLALRGVFVLIQDHNLDYPDFYSKLYRLFDNSIFHLKHRARFFRLADLFLKSTGLPSYLVAAFIKRLSRMCLYAPPSGCHVAVRFIYNLLKRHAACKVLIHRPNADGSKGGATIESDPFKADETDPAKACALESSLWEVQSLLSHYSPDVARLPKIFEIPALGKPEMDVRRAAEGSYTRLFKTEVSKLEEVTDVPTTFTPPLVLLDGDGWEW